MPPFSILSCSVRYLDLRGYNHCNLRQYYNDQECSSLIRSPLGIQCEFLLIEVEKQTNIIDLVNKMKYLRTLNVRCRDKTINKYNLIKYLQHRLPTTCTIAKESKSDEDIRLWIR
jgi:hypothetical protein